MGSDPKSFWNFLKGIGKDHPESGPFAYEHRIYTRRPWTTRLKITTFPRIYQYNGRLCFRWSEHRGSVAMDVREIKSIMCSPARRKKPINNKWLFRKGSFIDGCSCRGLVAGCYVNIISVKHTSSSFSLRIYIRWVDAGFSPANEISWAMSCCIV